MTRPSYRLVVASAPVNASAPVALIGRDLRSKPEDIAHRCLTEFRGIMEDVATISESIALADRLFTRQRGSIWSRKIELQIPVFCLSTFQRSSVLESLIDSIHFLTGDYWIISFVKRTGRPPSEQMLPFEPIKFKYVVPYSDGLDSFAQTRLLEKDAGGQAVLKLRSARMGRDGDELQRSVLRVPRYLGPMRKPEKTYRSRPFVFFSFAGIGAFVSEAEAVVVGETGQGSIGSAMIRYASEWPFRSTHPGFLSRLSRYLSLAFGREIPFRLPQIWKTKGEVLRRLSDEGLLQRWGETKSCSVRPNDSHHSFACGICGGCMLRSLAISSAGIGWPEPNGAFCLTSSDPVAADGKAMSSSERHMVVRSLGAIAEFARLAENPRGQHLIELESMLFSEQDSVPIAANLRDLVARHKLEWHAFRDRLPRDGWARAIVEQL